MSSEQHRAVRNAAWIFLQRLGLIVAGLLFAVLVPRMMGPDVYGQFALAFALAIWFTMLCELGGSAVMSRFMPEAVHTGDPEQVKRLFGNLFALRISAGLVASIAYFIVTSIFLRDVDHVALRIFAVAILFASATDALFSLFLGLNRAARWGICTLGRRVLMVIMVPLGFRVAGLRGAIGSMLMLETVMLIVGLLWARPYFSRQMLRIDFAYLLPLFQFGILFFVAGILSNGFRYSGEAIVRTLSGDYGEVGQFGVSLNLFAAGGAAIHQFFAALAPYLSSLAAKKQEDELRRWAERMLTGLTVAVVPVVFGALLIAEEVVSLLLGPEYMAVARNLLPLSLALLALVAMNLAGVMSLVMKKPSLAIVGCAMRLLLFWLLSVLLVPRYGSFGASIAGGAAALIAATTFTWLIRRVFPYSLKRWVCALAVALPFVALVFLKGSSQVNLLLFCVAVVAYIVIVIGFRVVPWNEIAALGRMIFKSRSPDESDTAMI